MCIYQNGFAVWLRMLIFTNAEATAGDADLPLTLSVCLLDSCFVEPTWAHHCAASEILFDNRWLRIVGPVYSRLRVQDTAPINSTTHPTLKPLLERSVEFCPQLYQTSLFHHRLLYRYSLDWFHGLSASAFSLAHRYCFSFSCRPNAVD